MMANKLESTQKTNGGEPALEGQETKARCCHYWIIETAKGPISKGVCKYCGEEKEFFNSWQDTLWEGDLSSLLNLPGVPDIGSEGETGS